MPEQNKPFVINDRRKFTAEGELRPDAPHSEEREPERPAASAEQPSKPEPIEFKPATAEAAQPEASQPEQTPEPEMPPPPTAQEMEQANTAYQQTADRLDTAVRAANPGMERPPVMDFAQIVQSVYMTTIFQLGGATQEGQQPKIDLMGARQSIDMLGVLGEKTKGNLTDEEARLLENALFEARMGFLEVTQALARSAAARGTGPGAPGGAAGPKIVR